MDALPEDKDSEAAYHAAPLLTTKRFVLGTPRLCRVDQTVTLADDRNGASMLPTMPHPHASARRWIGSSRRTIPYRRRRFAIVLRGGRATAIGKCDRRLRRRRVRAPRRQPTGLLDRRAALGVGFATEAAQVLVDFAFEVTNLRTIPYGCRLTDPASGRGIEKDGCQVRDMTMFHSPGADGSVSARRCA